MPANRCCCERCTCLNIQPNLCSITTTGVPPAGGFPWGATSYFDPNFFYGALTDAYYKSFPWWNYTFPANTGHCGSGADTDPFCLWTWYYNISWGQSYVVTVRHYWKTYVWQVVVWYSEYHYADGTPECQKPEQIPSHDPGYATNGIIFYSEYVTGLSCSLGASSSSGAIDLRNGHITGTITLTSGGICGDSLTIVFGDCGSSSSSDSSSSNGNSSSSSGNPSSSSSNPSSSSSSNSSSSSSAPSSSSGDSSSSSSSSPDSSSSSSSSSRHLTLIRFPTLKAILLHQEQGQAVVHYRGASHIQERLRLMVQQLAADTLLMVMWFSGRGWIAGG